MLKEEVVVGVLLDVELAHFVVEDLFEGVEVGALLGGDEEAVALEARHPCVDEFLQGDVARRGGSEVVGILFLPCVGVYLVEDYHLRLVAATEFGERLVHYLYLILKVRMADVNNVEEQVGLSNFVECAFEGVD